MRAVQYVYIYLLLYKTYNTLIHCLSRVWLLFNFLFSRAIPGHPGMDMVPSCRFLEIIVAELFAGKMSFVSPNQQHQNSEGQR